MIILDNMELNMFDVCGHIENSLNACVGTCSSKMLTSKFQKQNVQNSNMARKVKFNAK